MRGDSRPGGVRDPRDPARDITRVLLIQPHASADGLREAILAAPDLALESFVCPSAAGQMGARLPDVALLHLGADEDAAPECIATLRAYWPTCPIAAVSADPSLERLSALFLAGARGYLRWPLPAPDLAAALRLVAGGGVALCPHAAPLLTRFLLPQITRQVAALALSPREAAIGERIAIGQSNKTIAQDLDLAVKTVEWYVARLLQKTNMCSRVELAVWWSRNADRAAEMQAAGRSNAWLGKVP